MDTWVKSLEGMTDQELYELARDLSIEMGKRRPIETLEQHTREHLVSPGLCDADDCE